MSANHCPICATGELAFFQEADELQYKGQMHSVEVEYAVCQQCGEEMILPEQIRRNDCRARDVWRKVDEAGKIKGANMPGYESAIL